MKGVASTSYHPKNQDLALEVFMGPHEGKSQASEVSNGEELFSEAQYRDIFAKSLK